MEQNKPPQRQVKPEKNDGYFSLKNTFKIPNFSKGFQSWWKKMTGLKTKQYNKDSFTDTFFSLIQILSINRNAGVYIDKICSILRVLRIHLQQLEK